MLQDVFSLFQKVYDLFQLEFVIYGFTLSFWDIYVWTSLAGIFAFIFWRFLYD